MAILAFTYTQEDTNDPPIVESNLLALAEARSIAVKRYLIDKAVESSRMILCKAGIGDSEFGELTLSLD